MKIHLNKKTKFYDYLLSLVINFIPYDIEMKYIFIEDITAKIGDGIYFEMKRG